LDVVPFVPREERKVRDFLTLDNAAVRRMVDDELKRISVRAFERITSDPKAPTNVELNFLRAAHDLATYARLKDLRDQQLGLFVMTPTRDSIPGAELERLENILGEQSWSLEKQGFVVTAHDAAAPLARDVWKWSGVAN